MLYIGPSIFIIIITYHQKQFNTAFHAFTSQRSSLSIHGETPWLVSFCNLSFWRVVFQTGPISGPYICLPLSLPFYQQIFAMRHPVSFTHTVAGPFCVHFDPISFPSIRSYTVNYLNQLHCTNMWLTFQSHVTLQLSPRFYVFFNLSFFKTVDIVYLSPFEESIPSTWAGGYLN